MRVLVVSDLREAIAPHLECVMEQLGLRDTDFVRVPLRNTPPIAGPFDLVLMRLAGIEDTDFRKAAEIQKMLACPILCMAYNERTKNARHLFGHFVNNGHLVDVKCPPDTWKQSLKEGISALCSAAKV